MTAPAKGNISGLATGYLAATARFSWTLHPLEQRRMKWIFTRILQQ
jgi:hypothetical protein